MHSVQNGLSYDPRFLAWSRSPQQNGAVATRVKTRVEHHKRHDPRCDMLRLPNELLEQTALFLRPTITMHVLEGTGILFRSNEFREALLGEARETKQYMREMSNLRSLAMTCSRLRPIVERVLYQDIRLPLKTRFGFHIGNGSRGSGSCHPDSYSCRLARTLFRRPDLAAGITSLELWFLDRRLVRNAKQTLLSGNGPHFDVFSEACAKVSALPTTSITWQEKSNWLNELSQTGEMALQAVIVGCLPNLKSLTLSSHTSFWDWSKFDPRVRNAYVEHDRLYMDLTLRHSNLASLTVASYLPIRALPASSLTVLRLDINFFGNRLDWLDSPLHLPNVHSLSVIANHVGPFAATATRHWPLMSIRDGLRIFLKESVPNIQNFAIETPTGTIPMRKGQQDGKGIEAPVIRLDDPQDMEFHPLHYPWSDLDTWSWLTTTITPLKPRLTHLALPLNWYSSTGANTRPFSGLRDFTKLESLHIPKVAILRNRHVEESHEEDQVAAIDCLPKSLRSLVVSQVDLDTCKWVQGMLVHSNEHFPNLKHIRLVFRADQLPVCPSNFDQDVRRAGVTMIGQWGDVEESVMT